MNWKLKFGLQKLISFLPFNDFIYRKIQYDLGRLNKINIESKLGQADRVLRGLDAINHDLSGNKCVEIGSGWVFTVPYYFLLKGVKSLALYDIDRKIDYKANIKALQQFKEIIVSKENHSKIDQLLQHPNKDGFINALNSVNISYNAPKDFTDSGLEENTIDIVYSVTVFEHIPENILAKIINESFRVLKKGGIMAHLIDMGDHFSHTDKNISPINFLKFDEKKFKIINNKFLYQNRLRASDFERMFLEKGFKIKYFDPNVNKKSLKAFNKLNIDASFNKYSKEDLCTSSICIIASKN